MYSKAEIYNLAAGALLLTKQIIDVDNDKSKECLVFNIHWNTALQTALQDMDLDSTSSQKDLELLEVDPNSLWKYAYKYPTKCSFFRRIQNSALRDQRSNQIAKRVGIHNDKKVIFTNQENAVAEFISIDVPLATLSANAGMAIAYKLAFLSTSLLTGKAAKELKKEIKGLYDLAVIEAQEHDRRENANFETDEEMSEFVEARMS
ncbi:MAG: hypothetical protein ACKOX6_18235 [Bdellovibrio sp.]